jgi:hypothetical protein
VPINVNRRPHPFNAAGSPIYTEIESNRAVQSPGQQEAWAVNVLLAPPNGSTLTVDGFTYTFRLAPDAYNVADIAIGTPAVTAANIRDAINRNGNAPLLSSALSAPTVAAIVADLSVGAFTVVSSTANVTATLLLPYVAAVLRDGYRLVVEVFVESRWHHDSQRETAGKVYLPTTTTDFGTYENLVFELQNLLRPYVEFDVVSPNLQVAQFLSRCIRRFCLRWAEYFNLNQTAGLWFYDLESVPSNPDLSPYALPEAFDNQALYRALSAVAGQWEALLQLPPSPGGCLDSDTEAPYVLSPYFEGLNRYALNSGERKRTATGLVEFLNFWTGEFNDPTLFNVHILPEIDGVYVSNIATDNWFQLWTPNDCTGVGAGWANQLVTVPLHRLWHLPVWPSLSTVASAFCAFVYGPQGYQVEATELTSGLEWTDAAAVVGVVFTPPVSNYATVAVVATPVYDAPDALRLRILRSFPSPSINYAAARWLTVPPGTFQDNERYRVTFKLYVPSAQPDLFSGSGTIYISLASASFFTVVEQTVWTFGVDAYDTWVDLSLTVDTSTGAAAGISQLYIFVGNTGTTITQEPDERNIYLDELRVSRMLMGEVTVPRRYELEPCGDVVSFLFQNRLGCPETIHLFKAPDYSTDVDRLTAGATLDGQSLATFNDQADYQYRSQAALKIKGESGMMDGWESAIFSEFATSNNVYWLRNRCPNVNPCTGVSSFGPVAPLGSPGEWGLVRLSITDVPEGESFTFAFDDFEPCGDFTPPYAFERLIGETLDDFIDNGVVGLINFFGTNFAVREGSQVLVYLNLEYYQTNFGADICGTDVSICTTVGIPLDGVTVTTEVECVPFDGSACFWESVPVLVKTQKFDLQQGGDSSFVAEYEVEESRKFIVNTQ